MRIPFLEISFVATDVTWPRLQGSWSGLRIHRLRSKIAGSSIQRSHGWSNLMHTPYHASLQLSSSTSLSELHESTFKASVTKLCHLSLEFYVSSREASLISAPTMEEAGFV